MIAKLFLHPAIVAFLALVVFKLEYGLWVHVAILIAAQPVGVTPYLFASRYQVNVALASNAMLRSCMVSLLLVCALYAATAMRLQQGMFVIAANAIVWLDPRLLRVI